MSCLPVIAEEIDEFEQRLGVKLPSYYKARMSDLRIQNVFASKRLGVLRSCDTMMDYARLTESIRKQYSDFPQDGVLMGVAVDNSGNFNYNFGYPSFFLPDVKNPFQLSDIIYRWDVSRCKVSRDCSTEQWINTILSYADNNVLEDMGLEKPIFLEPQRFIIRECDNELNKLLALRGAAVIDAEKKITNQWILCTELELRGKYLSPCDLGQVPDYQSSISIPINPGRFKAEVQLEKSAIGDWFIVSVVRIVSGEPDYAASKIAGWLDIDLAAVAIFDRQAFFRKVAVDDREAISMDLIEIECAPCIMMLGKQPIFIVPTGDGDGCYPVIELKNAGVPIGIELRFKNIINR